MGKMDLQYRLLKHSTPEPNTGCWLWLSGSGFGGYGRIGINKITKSAHRVSYEVFKGKIPKGLGVLHNCDTPACINPDHLFVGTHTENMRDCLVKLRNKHMLKKEFCKNGHRFSDENVSMIKTNRKGQYRCCRICSNDRRRLLRRGA